MQKVCNNCSGSGWNFKFSFWPFKKCPKCNGTGFPHLTPRPNVTPSGQHPDKETLAYRQSHGQCCGQCKCSKENDYPEQTC